jgi:hypothetical protein
MCPFVTSGHFGFGGAAGSRIYLFQLVLLLNNVHPAINFKILGLLLNVGDVVYTVGTIQNSYLFFRDSKE